MHCRQILVRSAVSIGVVVAAAAPAAAAARTAPQSCVQAGDTGLTAVVSLSAGQHLHGTIDASACNLGVYVGPKADGAVVSHATITGSMDHAIFVQDANNVRIEHNTLNADVTNPNPNIAEDKAIELVGTRNGIVAWNTITNTVGSGGIGLSDDGPLDAGAPNPGTFKASRDNLVVGNTVRNSGTDCGIVLAAYDSGSGGVRNNTVQGNTVIANVAGIVVAADTPGTWVTGNSVVGNVIRKNFIPGVIIHSNAPSDVVKHTVVAQNILSGNGADSEAMGGNGPTKPTAIILAGEVETISGTTIKNNTIHRNEHFGIWIGNSTNTRLFGLGLDHAKVPVFNYQPSTV